MTAKILVVENDYFATTIEKRLEDWGYDVSKIDSTSENVVKSVKSADPDLILMDTFLNGESNCIDTSKLMDPEFKTPIIYYSDKIDEKLFRRVKTLPNRHYIQKTSKYLHLKQIIESILKKVDLNENEIRSIVNIYERSAFAQTPENGDDEESLSKNVENNDHAKIPSVNGNSFDEKDDLNDVMADIHTDNNYILRRSRKEHLKSLKLIIENNFKKEDYANLRIESTDNGEIIISKKSSDDYNQIQQKLEKKLKTTGIHLSKASDKIKTQEAEIKQLKETQEKHLNSIQEKEKLGKELKNYKQNQAKLEEKLQQTKTLNSKASKTIITQETRINQLKETQKDYINLIQEKEEKIKETEKHQQKLEETKIKQLMKAQEKLEEKLQNYKRKLENTEALSSKASKTITAQETRIKQLKEAEENYLDSIQEKEEKIKETAKHQQKLEEKLQKTKILSSKALDAITAQETRIKQLKETREKLQNSIQEKEEKIKETGQHQQKLEKKISSYKKHLQELEKKLSYYKAPEKSLNEAK